MAQISSNFIQADGVLDPTLWAPVVPTNAESAPPTFLGDVRVLNDGYGSIAAHGGDAYALYIPTTLQTTDQWALAIVKTVAPYTAVLAITACASVGGNSTYTYTVSSGDAATPISGGALYVVISGMQHSGNNGTFTATTFGVGTFTVANATPGANEVGSSGTGNCPSDTMAGVLLRGSGATAATGDGYWVHVGTNSFDGGGRWQQRELWKMVNGVGTNLSNIADSPTSKALPVIGDVIAISTIGSKISIYYNGVAQASVTDTDIAAGQPGLVAWSLNGAGEYVWANWGTDSTATGNNGTTLHGFLAGDLNYVGAQLSSDALTETVTQIATDNFNRADGAVGANWTTFAAHGLQIASHLVEGVTSGARNGAYWNANAFNNDQYSEVTIAGTAGFLGPGVRCATTSGENGYYALFVGTYGAPGGMYLQKSVTGTDGTNIVSNVACTVSVGDVVRIQVIGTLISVFINGALLFSHTDTSLATGSAGILGGAATNTTAQASLWAGGNTPPFPAKFTPAASQAFATTSTGAYASLVDGNSWAWAYDNTQTWPNDHYAQVTLQNQDGGGHLFGPCVRMSTSAQTYYTFASLAGTDYIYRYVAGVATVLNSTVRAFSNGDVYRLECYGPLIVGKVNGTIVVTAVDTVITAGSPGINSFTAGTTANKNFTAWSAGSIGVSAPAPASVSPTSAEQGDIIATFTVTGTNFDNGGTSTLSFSGTGITVNSYGTRNATTLVANITISHSAALTARDVIVTNADTQTGTLAAAFTITTGAAFSAPSGVSTGNGPSMDTSNPPFMGTSRNGGVIIR